MGRLGVFDYCFGLFAVSGLHSISNCCWLAANPNATISVNKRHFVIVKCGVAHLIFQDWKIDFQEYVPEDIQYEIIFLKTNSPSTNKAPQHCVYLCVSVCIYQILYHCYINGMKMGISHFIKLDLKLLDYVLLDVSAAFDLVDHNISLDRLKNWVGLSGTNDLNPI